MKTLVIQKDINRTDLTEYLTSARERAAELVCFGELATSGCLETRRTVPPLEEALALLRTYDFRVVTGLPVPVPEGLYNACLYCHGDDHQLYHKINLFEPFNEPSVFLPGKAIGIWTTDFGRVGVAICYDIRFDDIFEHLKEAGVAMIFIPAAFPRVRIEDWSSLLVRRARETGAYVIGINSVGNDGRHEFGGRSAVVSPEGKIIAEADEVSESVLEVDISVSSDR